MPALRKALGVEPNVRDVIHISFTPDGKRFAALVGQQRQEEPVDLLVGNADGSGITVMPAAIRGTGTQSGIVARVEFSPDGQWLCVAGKGPALIIRLADLSVRERVHTLTVTATDRAGNTTTASASYTVSVTYIALVKLIKSFIPHKGLAAAFGATLKAAEAADARGSTPAKNAALDAFIHQVQAHRGKALTAEQADLLAAWAAALKH